MDATDDALTLAASHGNRQALKRCLGPADAHRLRRGCGAEELDDPCEPVGYIFVWHVVSTAENIRVLPVARLR